VDSQSKTQQVKPIQPTDQSKILAEQYAAVLTKLVTSDEPFALSSQAKQIHHIEAKLLELGLKMNIKLNTVKI